MIETNTLPEQGESSSSSVQANTTEAPTEQSKPTFKLDESYHDYSTTLPLEVLMILASHTSSSDFKTLAQNSTNRKLYADDIWREYLKQDFGQTTLNAFDQRHNKSNTAFAYHHKLVEQGMARIDDTIEDLIELYAQNFHYVNHLGEHQSPESLLARGTERKKDLNALLRWSFLSDDEKASTALTYITLHRSIIKRLLKDPLYIHGQAVLHYLCTIPNNPTSNHKLLSLMLKHKIGLNALNNCQTPLMRATCSDNPQALTLLIKAGADLNIRDSRQGMTALMHAVETGNIEIITLLCDAQADVEVMDYINHTALQYAIQKHHSNVIELLLDKKAKLTPGMLEQTEHKPEQASALYYYLLKMKTLSAVKQQYPHASLFHSQLGYSIYRHNIYQFMIAQVRNEPDRLNKIALLKASIQTDAAGKPSHGLSEYFHSQHMLPYIRKAISDLEHETTPTQPRKKNLFLRLIDANNTVFSAGWLFYIMREIYTGRYYRTLMEKIVDQDITWIRDMTVSAFGGVGYIVSIGTIPLGLTLKYLVLPVLSFALWLALAPFTSLIYICSRSIEVVCLQPLEHNPAKKINMSIALGLSLIGLSFTPLISEQVLHSLSAGLVGHIGSLGATGIGIMMVSMMISIVVASLFEIAKRIAQKQNELLSASNRYGGGESSTAPKHHVQFFDKSTELYEYEAAHQETLSSYHDERYAPFRSDSKKCLLTQFEYVNARHQAGKLTQADYEMIGDRDRPRLYAAKEGRLAKVPEAW